MRPEVSRAEVARLLRLGDRHLFRLRDGTAFEGWLLDVRAEGAVVASAGPLAPLDEYVIPFDAIEPGTLSYVEDGRLRPLDPQR